MDLVGVPAQYLDVVWNDVKDRIAYVLETLSDEEVSVDEMQRMIANREAQLWTTNDKQSVCITRILKKLHHTEMVVWVLHSDNFCEEHWNLLDQIKEWARAQGCTKSRIVARPGFEKILVKHGWKRRHITLTQEI